MNRPHCTPTTLWLALSCVLGLGCSDGGGPAPSLKTAGGQSGTDSNSSEGCGLTSTDFSLDEHIPILEVSGSDLFELVGGRHELPGAWLATGEPVTLTVEVKRLESAHLDTACGPGRFGIVADVSTSDGSIQATATQLVLAAQKPALLQVSLPVVPEGTAPEGASGEATLSVSFELVSDEASPGVGASYVRASLDAGVPIGAWSSRPWELPVMVPSLYEAPAFMSAACDDAPDAATHPGEYTPYESESEARDAVIGTWVYCQKPVADGTVGFRIAADGSIVDLVQHEGEIVARGGLGHESELFVSDVSAMNEKPGLMQIGASTESGFLWNGALRTGDERGLRLLLRTDAPVVELSSTFASMQRGGDVACAGVEADVAQLADVDSLRSLLAGRWTRCSGSLPNGAEGITFDGSEQLSFQDRGGITLDSSRCDVAISGLVTGELRCPDFESTRLNTLVTIATRPLMLALEQGGRRAIFSALP
jgi:hypothetical protein